MSQAAGMLGINASTLSRRPDVAAETRGYRDLALRPAEVLRLGRIYRRRSINEVAADLVYLAGLAGAESQVEDECDEFFEREGFVMATQGEHRPHADERYKHWLGYRPYEGGMSVVICNETTVQQWREAGMRVEGPFVPCDHVATERAARAIGKALPLSQREGLHRTLAEAALRAAGETP